MNWPKVINQGWPGAFNPERVFDVIVQDQWATRLVCKHVDKIIYKPLKNNYGESLGGKVIYIDPCISNPNHSYTLIASYVVHEACHEWLGGKPGREEEMKCYLYQAKFLERIGRRKDAEKIWKTWRHYNDS